MKNSASLLILLFLSLSISLIPSINSQWQHSSSGMHGLTVYSLAVQNNKIIAGTPLSLSVSTNFGVNWYQTTFNAQQEPVHSLYVFQNNIYCGVQGYGLTASLM